MAHLRLCLVLIALVLFVSLTHAERARNDHRQEGDDDDDEEFEKEETPNVDDVVDVLKRFLTKKKTTTEKPSTGAISALITTTARNIPIATSTSVFGNMFNKKTSSTSRYGGLSSTSRYGGLSSTSRYGGLSSSTSRYSSQTRSPTRDACGARNPCQNGGTCKTLSTGSYYCFCPQDYYGKNCDKKFITSGAANNDRAKKDHCGSSPCRNNGECVALRTTYYCRCKSPFYGINCDKRLAKREEIVDDSNSSEQEITAFERDLEDDNEDLRRAIAAEDMLENIE